MTAAFLRRPYWGLWLALALCAAVYAPGLSGGFIFDDQHNIVDNEDLRVERLAWEDWKTAALSSPSAELRRPLAMASFAANYYISGLDPLPMKLTNLLVHLLNGLLLCGMLRELLELWRRHLPLPPGAVSLGWAATGLAAAWLLAPINLSPVLYVVQRMESLAQVFVLAGLWLYLRGRRRMLEHGIGVAGCAATLVLGTALGVLCKESAVLLPLYAFLAEWCLLRFEAANLTDRRRLVALFVTLLLLPGVAGLYWLLPRTFAANAFAGRPFTLGERLLTEGRILIDYMGWTLLPRPDNLGFYHDDILLSRGWLSPLSTALCFALIAGLLAVAASQRRRYPLLSLGIFWYFAAHLLTATIIPLELVFEHRNYFASVGLLLAAASLVSGLPARLGALRTFIPLLLVGWFAAVTALRAREWSDPLRFAEAEAAEHPQSARANYELGRALAIASGYRPESKLIEPSLQAFARAAALPEAGAGPAAAEIIVAAHMHRPIDPAWWQALTGNLAAQPPSTDDIGALQSLAGCQRQGDCPAQTQELLSAFLAAVNHPSPDPRLLADYGAFAANALRDYALSVSLLEDAIARSPHSTGYRIELVNVLLVKGDVAQAEVVLKMLSTMPLSGRDKSQFLKLQDAVAHLLQKPSA